jgi:hypothetical protein
MAVLTWYRLIPYEKTKESVLNRSPQDETNTHLELFSSVLVVCSIIVHQVDELEVVPLSTFVIVRVVSGGNLYGTGSESHVDGDGIGDDGESSVDEGVFDVLANEVLVAGRKRSTQAQVRCVQA